MRVIIKLGSILTMLLIIYNCTVLPGDDKSNTTTTISPDNDNEPTSDYIFNDTMHHKIEITIDNDIYNKIKTDYATLDDIDYRLASSFSFDGLSISNVGLKGRGGTTKDIEKFCLKLSFDSENILGEGSTKNNYPENLDRKFCKIKKLNLRNTTNDPTLIRELMAYKLYREFGVPAPRASTATLYINGKSMGVYLVVEDVTKRLVGRWFDDDTGNLYKCGWNNHQGASFQSGSYDSGRYELRTNNIVNDTTDIKSFITNISSVNDKLSLDSITNLDNLTGYMAVSSLVGHWDSLMGNVNNDFVYHNPKDNKWYVIVWDCDNTFGSDWINNTLAESYDRLTQDSGRVAEFCNKVGLYAMDEYKAIVEEIVNRYYNTDKFENEVARIRDMIKDEVKNDPYLVNYNNFITSFDDYVSTSPFDKSFVNHYQSQLGLTEYFKQRLDKFKSATGD